VPNIDFEALAAILSFVPRDNNATYIANEPTNVEGTLITEQKTCARSSSLKAPASVPHKQKDPIPSPIPATIELAPNATARTIKFEAALSELPCIAKLGLTKKNIHKKLMHNTRTFIATLTSL
jgi:hypothetical protein